MKSTVILDHNLLSKSFTLDSQNFYVPKIDRNVSNILGFDKHKGFTVSDDIRGYIFSGEYDAKIWAGNCESNEKLYYHRVEIDDEVKFYITKSPSGSTNRFEKKKDEMYLTQFSFYPKTKKLTDRTSIDPNIDVYIDTLAINRLGQVWTHTFQACDAEGSFTVNITSDGTGITFDSNRLILKEMYVY